MGATLRFLDIVARLADIRVRLGSKRMCRVQGQQGSWREGAKPRSTNLISTMHGLWVFSEAWQITVQCTNREDLALGPHVLVRHHIVGCGLGHVHQWGVCDICARHTHGGMDFGAGMRYNQAS